MQTLTKNKHNGKRVNHSPVELIAIGGSAGSFHALLQLLNTLPPKLNAAVCVVIHLAHDSNISFLLQHIQQTTSLKCKLAADGESIQSGSLYMALPNTHMLVTKKKIRVGRGPDENRFKPSIDVLFRSAAIDFRERVIGIILSGLADDGVAGMIAIKKCGGTCIVQDPVDAEFPDLPVAVIKQAKTDHTLSVYKMGDTILKSLSLKKKPVKEVPQSLIQETSIAEKMLTDIDDTKILGTQSLFTCPDCGGTLFHIKDGVSRYRCFTGHAFTEAGLLEKQSEKLLMTLWICIRMFEEKSKLLEKMPQSVSIKKRQKDLEEHLSTLKSLLADIQELSF